jgi:hypothetical protein
MFRPTSLALAFLALSACVTSTPTGAKTYVTRESATVIYTSANEPFTVKFKAGYGAPDFWCAAGRFANQQRLPISQPIYRLSPSPRPQGAPVQFSFVRPPGGGQPTGLNRISSTPDSLSASAARDQCRIVQARMRNR